jgi:hypothetical protein
MLRPSSVVFGSIDCSTEPLPHEPMIAQRPEFIPNRPDPNTVLAGPNAIQLPPKPVTQL